MQLRGTTHIPASQDKVWAALNDPGVLRDCIPGCESVTADGDNAYDAIATVKLGPVKAKFSGRINLTDIDAPNSYRINGEGSGGGAGFAKGGAFVKLTTQADGTELTYDVDATVGGKIAQVGQRLIESAAKKMAAEFFENFNKRVTTGQAPQDINKTAVKTSGPSRGLVILGIIVILAAIIGFLILK